jgi:hypothetical protein
VSSEFYFKGRLGVHLALIELLKLKIDVISAPYFWPFDLITKVGLKIEVKYSNIGIGKSGRGIIYKRYTFRVRPAELLLLDFLILVLNTQKGKLFYIIPKSAIDSKTIAFNPFSRQKSKYEKYLNRWDLIINAQNLILDKKKFKKAMESEDNFFARLYKHQVKNK